GVREQNVTLGLPRLIEIVDARRVPSTPIMTIYLDEEHRKTREKAKEIAQKLIHTTMDDLISEMYVDEIQGALVIKLDIDTMEDRGITKNELKRALRLAEYTVEIGENEIIVRPKEEASIAKLRKLSERISKIHVKGVPNIRRVLVTEEEGEWVIRTDGSNLPRVLEMPGVDPTRTITNHIKEIAATLGIEAARNAIINEAMGVLEEQGLDVDIRHIMLVADIMTSKGTVQQIGRHGVSGEKGSVLARAAFEVTVPNIVEAAIRGEVDELRGVTENVIVGQSVPVGTGLVDLYMSVAPSEVKRNEPR
ncbi:DNA-directed RNA polymerase subunit A'', partial [Candidatus Bathyarchaeota archaeon]